MAVRKATVRQLTALDRQRQALELRKSGLTFEAIAAQLDYKHASGAAFAVASALKKTLQEPADSVRMIELARLDAMLAGLWKLATHGDTYAVDRVLKIMDRRAAYLGLDAPKEVKVAHEMEVFAGRVAADLGLDPADVIAEAERIVAASGATD